MKACDGLDGAEDGVISNVAGCQSTIDLQGREIIHGVNLLRLLPAGAVAGWGSHPRESAAFSRRTRTPDIRSRAALRLDLTLSTPSSRGFARSMSGSHRASSDWTSPGIACCSDSNRRPMATWQPSNRTGGRKRSGERSMRPELSRPRGSESVNLLSIVRR